MAHEHAWDYWPTTGKWSRREPGAAKQKYSRGSTPLLLDIERHRKLHEEATKNQTPRQWVEGLVAGGILSRSMGNLLIRSGGSAWGKDGKSYGMSFDPVTHPEKLDLPTYPQ